VRTPLRLLLILAPLAASPACGSGDGPAGPDRVAVASVSVAPASVPLEVGATAALTATTFDADGRVLAGRAVAWTSSAPEVARVGDDGVVTAVAVGTATVTATSEGKGGGSTITVVRPSVYSISVEPAEATLPAGTTTQLSAVLRDRLGNVLSGRDVSWTSLDPAVAVLQPAPGAAAVVVNGRSVGTARIVADAEGRSDTALVVVSPAPIARVVVQGPSSLPAFGTGCPDLLSDAVVYAYAYDRLGGLVSGRPVEWSFPPGSGSVARTYSGSLPANAVQITAVRVGTAYVSATVDGVTGGASVSIYSCATFSIAP